MEVFNDGKVCGTTAIWGTGFIFLLVIAGILFIIGMAIWAFIESNWSAAKKKACKEVTGESPCYIDNL